jgi:hypothetical protein
MLLPNLGRPDPRFANVTRFESLGRSAYHAMTLVVAGTLRVGQARAEESHKL